jgi:hypothetical protein
MTVCKKLRLSFSGVSINKINKEIVLFAIFLILIILAGIFIKTPVKTEIPAYEPTAGGLSI